MKKNSCWHLAWWAWVWTIPALFLLPALVLLGVSGELSPVAPWLSGTEKPDQPSLAGTAYSDATAHWKKEAWFQRRPAVVALGSSRVLMFRGDFFRQPDGFFNAGRIASFHEFAGILRSLPAEAAPRTLLLGVDPWWFEPGWYASNLAQKSDVNKPPPSPIELFQWNWRQVLEDVQKGKIGLSRLFSGIPGVRTHGLTARMHTEGYLWDGSYWYGRKVAHPGDPRLEDAGFADTLSRIRTGTKNFAPCRDFDPGAIRQLTDLLDLCREKNIRVCGFLPPLAPTVLLHLRERNGEYPQFFRLQDTLGPLFARRGFSFFDGTDATALGSGDDEMIDGFHGSDTTYARLLLLLAAKDPRLGEEVDPAHLESLLEHRRSGCALRPLEDWGKGGARR